MVTQVTVKTNDLKKGDRVRLRNGWYGTLTDNKRGNIREVRVEGFSEDTGGQYAHDIVSAFIGGNWVPVEHTPAQLRCKAIVKELFGG